MGVTWPWQNNNSKSPTIPGIKYKAETASITYQYGSWRRSGKEMYINLGKSPGRFLTATEIDAIIPGGFKVKSVAYQSLTEYSPQQVVHNLSVEIEGWTEYLRDVKDHSEFNGELELLLK